jgi:hypothetical protein
MVEWLGGTSICLMIGLLALLLVNCPPVLSMLRSAAGGRPQTASVPPPVSAEGACAGQATQPRRGQRP